MPMTNDAKAKLTEKNKFIARYGLQETFDTLYSESKKGKTFNRLFEIVVREDNILLAYRNLRMNKGSRTPGIDGKSIKDLDQMSLDTMIQKVRNKLQNYNPNAVRRVEIPKPNGKLRPLGIPSIIDRLCQQALLQVMEPICEAKFNPHSYGFRPGYSAENAISDLQRSLQLSHCHYIVDVDIEGFFDNIDHSKLKKQIWAIGIRDKKIIKIISQMLSAPIVLPDGTWVKPEKGTPQGGIISPLLANIALNEFDWWVESQWREFPSKRNHGKKVKDSDRINQGNKYKALRGTKRNPCNLKEVYLIRYADDVKLVCRNHNDAVRMYHAATQWLQERLHLKVSPEKSKITNCKKTYTDFLGFRLKVKRKGDKYVLTSHICDKALKRCHDDLKEQLNHIRYPKGGSDQILAIAIYNLKVRGIQNYYSLATECVQDMAPVGNDLRYVIDKIGRKLKPSETIPPQFAEYAVYRKQLRVVHGQIILPISGFKHRNAMGKNRKVNKYEGNKASYNDVIGYLMNSINSTGSVKYHTFRISRWYAQSGRCAVLDAVLAPDDIHCHHKLPKELGGTDDYENLIIIHANVHHLVHAVEQEVIQKYLDMVGPLTIKQMDKVNKLREKVGNPAI